MIRGIKTCVEKENQDEYYLNPKDNIINEHYNQLLFKSLPVNLLFYLPRNEIIIIILEEKLIIYDIKISITESLKIIDEIFYKDIIKIFSEIKIIKTDNVKVEKVDKNKKTTYFMGLNFISKEQEDKQIKNIMISEDFYNKKGLFIIIIEFMNLDIYIIEYNLLNEINNNPKFTLILKADKYLFVGKTNLNIVSNLNENYYKNAYKTKFKIINYLNSKIFLLYQHQYNFYIYNFKINEISSFAYINQNKNKNKNNDFFLAYDKISLKEEFTYFDANYCNNFINNLDYFEFINITINNKIFYHLFLLEKNGNNKNCKQILNKEIEIDNISNISNINFCKNNNDKINDLLSEKVFFIIQLNKIYIISYFLEMTNNVNLVMNISNIYLLHIVEFSEEQIYNIFLLQKKYLYIFTRKNKYIEYYLDLKKAKKNNKTDIITINEKPKYFKIAKFIYDIKPFQSENGFFILITQNSIRPINMNIIYKLNYNNLIPIENNFSEGLIIGLRNSQDKIEFINKENNYIFNKRYNYFLNKIFKGNNSFIIKNNNNNKMEIEDEDKDKSEQIEENNDNNKLEIYDDEDFESKNEFDDLMRINSEKYKKMEKKSIIENEVIKNELINFYSQKSEKNGEKEKHLKYLNNEKYICEFCGEKFNNFDKNERIYKCYNNDITFCCCLSNMPINNDFLWCSYCTLFYSNELKLYYCIICDKILNNLDSL